MRHGRTIESGHAFPWSGFFRAGFGDQRASSSLLETTQPMFPSSSETFHHTPT